MSLTSRLEKWLLARLLKGKTNMYIGVDWAATGPTIDMGKIDTPALKEPRHVSNCGYCGEELIIEPVWGYDQNSGDGLLRDYILRCPHAVLKVNELGSMYGGTHINDTRHYASVMENDIPQWLHPYLGK